MKIVYIKRNVREEYDVDTEQAITFYQDLHEQITSHECCCRSWERGSQVCLEICAHLVIH